ncbi:rod shape-determining protein MreD [Flavobacterium sp. CS20]|jgi:rod shape-determining protein MreD|uniref:rod shape-determining protein MreD n=1 Tax=Flavobacterium sp. CS20 TaxID=2775246 RepID=UPI001B3A23D6|nr:rod shape-determining protein MreD [Flavobacterium sp. CS20]QTY26784.1 rod shape-determining protein MreD [Flavobacterium sp. CS20]
MNSFNIKYIIQFILLVLVQVLVLDYVLLSGYINPYIYMMFILMLPFDINRLYLLLIAFVLGITIDLFNDTGGVHAGSTLIIAYLRPVILRLSFGLSYDYNSVNLKKADFSKQIIYVVLMVLIHHFLMFSLEYFSINYALDILKNTIYSSIFSSILIIIILRLFKP